MASAARAPRPSRERLAGTQARTANAREQWKNPAWLGRMALGDRALLPNTWPQRGGSTEPCQISAESKAVPLRLNTHVH